MTQGPEAGLPPEAAKPSQNILRSVDDAAKKLNQIGVLPEEQKRQVVGTVIGGVIELHRQGVIGRNEKVRVFLQNRVFTPAHQLLSEELVAGIETMAGSHDPQVRQAVPARLELSTLLGINDQAKFPNLAPRLETISARVNQPEKPKPKKEKKPRSNNKDKAKKNLSSDDFIPLADETAPEEPDVTQSALLVAFGDVIGYLPDTLDNRDMLEQAAVDNRQALSKLAGLAVGRGYLGRAVQNLTHLTAQYPQRTEEIIPILEALSDCDSRNPDPEVYKLLGDTYLQLGKHKEAIAAYRETLKIPPKE